MSRRGDISGEEILSKEVKTTLFIYIYRVGNKKRPLYGSSHTTDKKSFNAKLKIYKNSGPPSPEGARRNP